MKTIAFILLISCLEDIIRPCIIMYRGIKKYKYSIKTDTYKINLIKFIKCELLNIIALIFFISFIIKY